MKKILYIEDELNIGMWIKDELESKNYHVIWLKSKEDVFPYLDNIDLIILDPAFPKFDGYFVGKQIRTSHPQLPIIILSTQTSLEDKIQGLEFADVYLIKPPYPRELIIKVESLLKKYDNYEKNIFSIAHLEIYPNEQRIVNTYTKEDTILPKEQYQLFSYFIKHMNQTLTKEQIVESIWKQPYEYSDNMLMTRIRQLREKIEMNPSDPKIIRTIPSIGYKFQG